MTTIIISSILRNGDGIIDRNKDQLAAFNNLWLYTTDVLISSIIELIDAIELAKSRISIHILRGIEWGLESKVMYTIIMIHS